MNRSRNRNEDSGNRAYIRTPCPHPRIPHPASCILSRMSNDATTDDDERRKWTLLAIAAAALLLLLFSVIAIGTLRGCFFAESEQAADATEKKKKDADKEK